MKLILLLDFIKLFENSIILYSRSYSYFLEMSSFAKIVSGLLLVIRSPHISAGGQDHLLGCLFLLLVELVYLLGSIGHSYQEKAKIGVGLNLDSMHYLCNLWCQ